MVTAGNPSIHQRLYPVLLEIISSINSSLNLDLVLSNIIEKTKELTGGADCQLIIRDHETGNLIIHTPFHLEGGLSEGSTVDPDKGLTGWVVRNKKTLNIPDVTKDTRYECWIPDTRSEITIPLLKEDELIGVINIESPRINAFDEEMVEILNILMAHATSAIVNAELFDKYKTSTRRLAFSKYLASVGEVSSELIHWFGNKAGLIIGCAESIKAEAGGNESILEDIGIIRRHMAEVLNMKKRILGDNPASEIVEVNLREFLQKALKDFNPDIVKSEEIPDDLTCKANPDQLINVIHTIIENSIDACQDCKDFLIRVSAFREDDITILQISDNGPGYPKESLGHLFKPFFSTKQGEQSTGMGLWLCYRMLKTMNGEVRVDGDTGKGLTFNIRLQH